MNEQSKHGHSRRGQMTAEYRLWLTVRQRCFNPKRNGYENYGGRGITVCPRWVASFDAFLGDIGKRPSNHHTLDRIDNDGNYEPSNVRWATRKEQARNRRTTKMVTIDGRTLMQAEWLAVAGISDHTLRRRMAKGIPMEEALFMGDNRYRACIGGRWTK